MKIADLLEYVMLFVSVKILSNCECSNMSMKNMKQEDNINFRRFQEWLNIGPDDVLNLQIKREINPELYLNPKNKYQHKARIRP